MTGADVPAAARAARGVPAHIAEAIAQALEELPQPANRFERDRWRVVSRVTYFAVAPHIRAAALEWAAQQADGLKFRLYRPARDGPGGGAQALDVIPAHELLSLLRQGGEGGTHEV